MRKKQVKKRYILITIIAAIMIILIIISLTLKEDRKTNKFSGLLKDTIISTENIISYPFKIIIDKFSEYKELINIRKKYNDLLINIDKIEEVNAENIELRQQIDALKEELNISTTINGYTYLNATVLSRNITSWYNTVLIDKGSYNGVEVGMAVVSSKGLIGKISSVTTFNSEVKLITTPSTSNKISVSIIHNKEKIYGLINGYNYHDNYLEVEGISNTIKVSNDDYVYTSGLGGVFPSGILIGKVKEITIDDYGLSKILKVEPIENFNNINYVAILKRKDGTK